MTKRGKAGFLSYFVVAIALFLTGATNLWADTHARIVRLSYIEGDNVLMDRGDGRGFQSAFLNMPVIHGARVWTKDSSRAEIEFEDGSTLRMTPETLLTVQDLTLLNDGEMRTVIDVQEGTVYFNIKKKEAPGFRVIFAHQELFPTRSTAHFRLLLDRSESVLAVFKGSVLVSNSTPARVEVRKGETVRLEPSDNSRYYLAKGVDNDAYDSWDKEREEYRDQYSARNAIYTYGGNNIYGLSDLNYYGNYINVPSYGVLWRPYYAGLSWDPFMDGSWVYYPAYGYVWVSPYQWGWIPYRYGSWQFVPTYGWCWQPGGFNNWVTTPVVRNPPPNYGGPVPPSPGAGLAVVTVGRGPRVIVPGDGIGTRRIRAEDSRPGVGASTGQSVGVTTTPNPGQKGGNSPGTVRLRDTEGGQVVGAPGRRGGYVDPGAQRGGGISQPGRRDSMGPGTRRDFGGDGARGSSGRAPAGPPPSSGGGSRVPHFRSDNDAETVRSRDISSGARYPGAGVNISVGPAVQPLSPAGVGRSVSRGERSEPSIIQQPIIEQPRPERDSMRRESVGPAYREPRESGSQAMPYTSPRSSAPMMAPPSVQRSSPPPVQYAAPQAARSNPQYSPPPVQYAAPQAARSNPQHSPPPASRSNSPRQ